MTLEELQEQLQQARESLRAFVEQANRQVAAQEGAIAMLEMLIARQTPDVLEEAETENE